MAAPRARATLPFAPISRVRLLAAGVALILATLIGRLYYLQIVRGTSFRAQAESNRTRLLRHASPP